MWGKLSTTCSNATEVARLGASCSRPQPGVEDGGSSWPAATPTQHTAVILDLHVLYGTHARHNSQDLLQPVRREHTTIGMPGQRTVCAVTRPRRRFVAVLCILYKIRCNPIHPICAVCANAGYSQCFNWSRNGIAKLCCPSSLLNIAVTQGFCSLSVSPWNILADPIFHCVDWRVLWALALNAKPLAA